MSDQMPYIVHESSMVRMERINRRLWILCIILVVLLFGTNAGWLFYESQFQTDQTTVQQDVEWEEGSNVVLNGTGEVSINGQSEANSNN